MIEAVPEAALKRSVFSSVVEHAPPTAILGTNTSSLSIADVADGLPHPDRVIGMHFFNPVHIMKLLEIIVAEGTSRATFAAAEAYGARIGKQTIRVRDVPGFATSRLGLVIGLEAIRMVEQGVASAEDIDRAMTLGYGFPMGPLRLTDLVGLDVRLHIAEYLAEHLPDGAHFRPPRCCAPWSPTENLGRSPARASTPGATRNPEGPARAGARSAPPGGARKAPARTLRDPGGTRRAPGRVPSRPPAPLRTPPPHTDEGRVCAPWG